MWCCTDSQDVGLEAAIMEGKRNSSLVKRHCAENVTGLKHSTEAAEVSILRNRCLVGEHSVDLRSSGVSQGGGDRRDYAGISNVNSDEKSGRRKPKVSWGR